MNIKQQAAQIKNFDVRVVLFEALRRRKEAFKKMDDLAVIQEATRRRNRLREELGPYATVKKMVQCKACHKDFSVRKLREHWPKCTARKRLK